MTKILIKGGTIVNADQAFKADVYIEDGKIAAIGQGLDYSADETIDASGQYVMPGGIDPHTHMQLPFMGTVASDDFFTGTSAALAGGTTKLIDFVIPGPGSSLMEAYRQWREWAEKSACDYGFHMAITWFSEQVAREMAEATAEGINSFKHFMAYKGALMADDEILVHSFTRVKELGGLALVHAENGEMVAALQKKIFESGITGPEGHPLSRPPEVEGEAANRAVMLAGQINVPLYIVHTSCKEAVDAIDRGQKAGYRIIGESLVNHLAVDDRVYQSADWDYAAHHVMSPPFRPAEHKEHLWNALEAGIITVTGSDHAVFMTEQKRGGLKDFRIIPNGTAAVEDRMSVIWHLGVNSGRLTPSEFVAVTSANAAKVFNIYPKKGLIAAGSDADLVVWDPRRSRTISAKTHVQNVDFNIFEGLTVTGNNRVTISGGKIAYMDGDLRAVRGAGQYVKRPAFGPLYDALTLRDAALKPVPVKRKSVAAA